MKEQLIRFKTAKLAKEKGFNIHCIECYMPNGEETLDLDNVMQLYPVGQLNEQIFSNK